MKTPLALIALLTSLLAAVPALAQAPDLTNPSDPDYPTAAEISQKSINLGPSGLTGWIFHEKNPDALLGDWNYTGQSRQILVSGVDAGSPGESAGILVGDVILGASGDGSTPVDFSSDARKSLALAIADAEARSTPELKLKVWRGGSTSTYTITLQNLGAYGPDAPVSDAKCDLILENARQALLLQDNPGSFALGTLALIALDDPAHPDHAVMKAQIDSEITAIMLSNGELPEAGKPGWQRGHSLIVLAEYYLTYGEHPSGGIIDSIEAYVDDITAGQSIFGTFGHIFAQFRWPEGDPTPMMGGYGAINSSAVPGLYGLMLAKECAVVHPALDESIDRGLTFYGSYADRGAIPYGEHTPGVTEFSSNGKSGAAALLFDLATGKEEEAKYFAKMSAASFHEYETGHTGSYFQSLWTPLGAALGGDEAIKSYFAETSWLLDLARKWDGSFAYNHITAQDNYVVKGFNSTLPYIMTYALPLKRLHMTGRGRAAAGVLSATERAEAVYSANYDETTRTKAELIGDLADWSVPVRFRAATALAVMALTSTDMDTLHALASDPLGASREGALLALEKIAEPASAPVLSAILSDPDPHIRRLAADALIWNPAKAGELNTVLAAAAAAERPVFPMDPRDPLQHDLLSMGNLLFSRDNNPPERGILCVYPNIVLDGVDRQLLYPAVRAIATSSTGSARSSLQWLLDALDEADVKALGDTIVDTALYRAPADPMFADPARERSMDALVRYAFAEAVPVAERSIRADFNYNANRDLYGEMFKDLQQFGGTNRLVTPDPNIDQLCIDFIGAHWNTFGTANNVAQAYALIDAMETDDAITEPLYLKNFDWIVTDAAELTLPANQTQLHVSVTDHAKGNLSYTWRKIYGPGNVTFSENGTATSRDTTVTFDNIPGPYLFEVAVVDARGLSEITGNVAMTLYDSGGNLPSNLPPAADPQPVTAAPFTATPITLTGSDPESDPLVFTVTSQPVHGTLSGTAPNLSYTTDVSYHTGTDNFTFEVTDSFGQTSSATVTITVDPSALVTYVHEPFDYPVGAGLAGNAGGIGMTGGWLDGPDSGLAWIYDETTAITPAATSAGNLSWDGIVNNLPALSGAGAKFVGLGAGSGDKFEIHRALAQDAGTMAGPDNVLWASVAYHRDSNSFAQHIGFMLSTDSITNQGRALDTSGNHGSGAGDGIGFLRPFDVGSSYAAVVFDGGSPVASTTAPEFASGDFIMVLKFEFGATDTVTAYAFREDDFVSEETFYARAVSATAAIDESTLTRIAVAAGRGDPAYDEIRVADSFAAVLGLGNSPDDVTPPAPDPMTFASAPAALGTSSITMTATTASDPSGVEYYFTCTSGNGNDSGWQDSPIYTDTLGAGSYTYAVTARDKSENRNLTAASAPQSATLTSATPGVISWEVFDILGDENEVSTAGALVEAHAGADLGPGNVVDGTTMTLNTVVFDDGFVFDSPSHLDTIGNRAGNNVSGDCKNMLQFADRQSSGTATFTFSGLTTGNTYQVQVWHTDNASTAQLNGMVVNSGGTVDVPTPGTPGHATLIREVTEGNAGQYAIGTFVADATSMQFLAKAYGNLPTTPTGLSNVTINGVQLRLLAIAPDSTPPALSPVDIVDDQGGASVAAGTVVVYQVTFSRDMDGTTVDYADFSNAGTAPVTVGTVAQLSPTVYQVRMTALSVGTLQLQVNAGAVLTDLSGNPLDTASAILDDTTITVGSPQTTVPNVLGQVQTTAESNIVAANLMVGTVSSQYDFAVPAGNVISQSPAGGASVDVDSSVDLVVSLGPPLTTVPNVVGQVQATAEANIVAANLVVGTVTSQYDAGVSAGNVISQSPIGAFSVVQGSSVDLVVSLGAPQTTVPDVTGLAQAIAESNIVAATLVVGTVTSQYDELVPEGDVISQSPAGGLTMDESSSVDLVVSQGPAILIPGKIAWNVFDISGNVSEVSTEGTLVQAHGGADLGTGDVVDGSTFDINGVTFDDGFVFDSPSHKDTIGNRGGSYSGPNAGYATLMRFADRQGSGNAKFTFSGLTPGSTYQIQVWHGDNISVAAENGMVVNNGGIADTPDPSTSGHATLVREISEGGYGQYAIGTFVAASSTQQFLARAYGNLTATPTLQSNTTINGCQLRLIASGSDTTQPTLTGADIVDDQTGANVTENGLVTYAVTFSEDMEAATLDAADFSNAGSSSVTIGSVTEISPGVFGVQVTPTAPGTLQLQVSAGAVLSDVAGNLLDTTSAIADDTAITVDPAMVPVPGVVGLAQAAAWSDITAANLVVGTNTTEYSDTVPAGDVISQNPVGGSSAAQGSAINLVVSLGVEMVTVPNVVGLPQATAESGITAAQLTLGNITQEYSASVQAGYVISQGLSAGASVPHDSALDIVVSLGANLSPKLVRTTVNAVSNTSWTTVSLGQTYNSAVIIATPIYPAGVTIPVATRITNVTGTGFDMKLDRADGLTAPVSFDVSVIAVDEGVYTQAVDGVAMEAVKFTSSLTARKSSWSAEARTFQNVYTNPVVVGQVMSANDANWSVFWSMGSNANNPVDASNFNVGKHVGEDPNTTRADETIGYIVIEAGTGTIGGVAYEAGLGADSVQGFDNSGTPYGYTLGASLSTASSAALSQSGMDGNDGSWAVLAGSQPLSPASIGLYVCEDKLKDSEQSHVNEQVGYIVFE